NIGANSPAQNQFNGYLATLTTGLSGTKQIDSFDIPTDPNLIPNYIDPLLVGIYATGIGSNPIGIASGPALPTDYLVDAASVLATSAGNGGRVQITYTVVGQLTAGDLLSATFTSADGSLNVTESLSGTAAGTYT